VRLVVTRRGTQSLKSKRNQTEKDSIRVARHSIEKQIGRPRQERVLFSRTVWPKLNGSSTAEKVEQDGNYGKNQQNVDESAGDVKRSETQQPQYQ
jgi:hypothetical protein